MSSEAKSANDALGVAVPSAADIRRITQDILVNKAAEAEQHLRAQEEEQRQHKEMFMARKLTPEAVSNLMARVRRVAEAGESKLLIGQFPSDLCSDGGRRINIADKDWPETLPKNIAREFFDYWERELKPKGFALSAETVNFKAGGIPGDVGFYLSWQA